MAVEWYPDTALSQQILLSIIGGGKEPKHFPILKIYTYVFIEIALNI